MIEINNERSSPLHSKGTGKEPNSELINTGNILTIVVMTKDKREHTIEGNMTLCFEYNRKGEGGNRSCQIGSIILKL